MRRKRSRRNNPRTPLPLHLRLLRLPLPRPAPIAMLMMRARRRRQHPLLPNLRVPSGKPSLIPRLLSLSPIPTKPLKIRRQRSLLRKRARLLTPLPLLTLHPLNLRPRLATLATRHPIPTPTLIPRIPTLVTLLPLPPTPTRKMERKTRLHHPLKVPPAVKQFKTPTRVSRSPLTFRHP